MSENIYNLVPREYVPPVKEPMHKSSFDPKASLTGSTFGKLNFAQRSYLLICLSGCFGTTKLYGAGEVVRKDGALYGPPKPETGLPLTTKAKMDSSSASAGSGKFSYTDKRKSPVPSKEDKPVLGITHPKNYITANAVEAILQGKSYICTLNDRKLVASSQTSQGW